ncbi:MAG: hypothetical protein AAF958_15360 [Planctomycetota bacterium]
MSRNRGYSQVMGRPFSSVLFALLLAIATGMPSSLSVTRACAQGVPRTRLVPYGSPAPAMAPSPGFTSTPNSLLQATPSPAFSSPTFSNPAPTPPVYNPPNPAALGFDPYARVMPRGPAAFGLPYLTPNPNAGSAPASFSGWLGGLFGDNRGGLASGPVLNSPLYPTPGTFDNPSVNGPPVATPIPGFGQAVPGFGQAAPGFGQTVPGFPQGNFGLGGGSGSPFAPSPGFGGAAFPQSIYPSSTPSTLFPQGMFSGGPALGGGGPFSAYRLLHGPRIRHGFVGINNDEDDLETNDTDVSAIFAFPNFLYSTQPLYVIPSFSLHLFDGPDSSTGADLPAQTYGGFLDFGYNSDPNRILGTELGLRVGVFSDFDHFDSDSLRVLGKGLVHFRLTPATTLKAGAYYLDRVDWKLIPAGGLLYQPNPYTRWDLFFPQPKLARYLQTVGTYDVWWYLSGDYGGGSWTVRRDGGGDDQVDLNDLRAIIGLEWGLSNQIRAGRRVGFMEVGYVFDRELVYRANRDDNLDLDDAFMFRIGLGY